MTHLQLNWFVFIVCRRETETHKKSLICIWMCTCACACVCHTVYAYIYLYRLWLSLFDWIIICHWNENTNEKKREYGWRRHMIWISKSILISGIDSKQKQRLITILIEKHCRCHLPTPSPPTPPPIRMFYKWHYRWDRNRCYRTHTRQHTCVCVSSFIFLYCTECVHITSDGWMMFVI